MKKITKPFAVVAALLIFSEFLFAGAGLSFNAGYKSNSNNFNDVDSVQLTSPGSSFAIGDSSNDFFLFQVNAFYEQPKMFGLSDKSIFGVSAGYGVINGSDFRYSVRQSAPVMDFALDIKTDGYRIPFGIYYKYKTSNKFAVKCGFGATYTVYNWEETLSDFDGNNPEESSKNTNTVMPRIDAGFEWLFSKIVTLGMDFSYTFNGKMENPFDTPGQSETFYTDYSGISASLALRCYIF